MSDLFLKRMLKRVSAYGVMKIGDYSMSPSGNRIVFAGVFDDFLTVADVADLWLVNRDGSGLRRLTVDRGTRQPAWSPSEREIAFVAFPFYGSVCIIDVKTRKVRWPSGLQALHPGERGTHARENYGYVWPQWSLIGKAIAAEGAGEGDGWITVVDARSGNKIFDVFEGSFSWNHEGELGIGTSGKFVFDWNSALFKRH